MPKNQTWVGGIFHIPKFSFTTARTRNTIQTNSSSFKIHAFYPFLHKNMHYTVQSLPSILFLASFVLLFCSLSHSTYAIMAEASSASSEAKVHIIYTERPQEGEDPESFHLKTLTSVCGSEEAAKGALLYSYKHAASGFSAKLTPEQVEQLSKKPGVLQVVPSQTLQLHSGPNRLNV